MFPGGEGSDVNTLGIVCALVSAFTYGGYLIVNEKGPANDLLIAIDGSKKAKAAGE